MFRVGDIVIVTTNCPKGLISTSAKWNWSGTCGVITEIVDDPSPLLTSRYFRLNDGFLFDVSELRYATEEEIEHAARKLLGMYPNTIPLNRKVNSKDLF